MPNALPTLLRRALAALAVALIAGAAACGEAPTAAGPAPRARAASELAKKQQPGKATTARGGRRGGYNVVAD